MALISGVAKLKRTDSKLGQCQFDSIFPGFFSERNTESHRTDNDRKSRRAGHQQNRPAGKQPIWLKSGEIKPGKPKIFLHEAIS